MDGPPLIFRVHAVQRMFQRGITEVDVHAVLESGEPIEVNPSPEGEPTTITLGWVDRRPLHVVHVNQRQPPAIIVITV